MKKEFLLEGRRCVCHGSEEPSCVLIQAEEAGRLDSLETECQLIGKLTERPFMLVGFAVDDWNKDLSPWKAPAVFGNEEFGDGAGETLSYIQNTLIPYVFEVFSLKQDIPLILGGYSLAGLFALWSAFESDLFSAVSGASASVWFPGWMDYVGKNECRASHVYLSLGDREEKTRNAVMATVGNCMRKMDRILAEKGIDHVLQWNEGNHFRDAELRCAKGFAWAVERPSNG